MKVNRILALAAAGALILALGGCSQSPSAGSSVPPPDQSAAQPPAPVRLPFALAIYPDFSMHPVLAVNRANLTLAPLLYEPLFLVDEQFQPVPVLCQSHSVSPDKLTWTFVLRSGVSFSDGTPLTAQIAADALELARGEGSRYAQRLRDVVSISAQDQTLTIVLSRPNGRLPSLLDIPIALTGDPRPLGTGPYKLGGTEDAPVLLASDLWWQDKALPARSILLETARSSDDLIYAFDGGDLSLVDVDMMGTNALGYAASSEAWDYATTGLLYLGFNAQKGLCRDPAVRHAIGRAIDRQTIADTVFARHAQAAALPVHPASSLYNEGLAAQLYYDPQILADQLTQTRVPAGGLVFVVNSENTAKLSAATLIAYQLEAAGVPVELQKLSFDDYTAALTRGAFDLYLGEVVLTADFDLSPLLSAQGPLNYGGWHSEAADTALSALMAAGPDQAPSAAFALFELLVEDPPLAPICFKNGSVLTQWGRLTGLNPVRGNVFYQLENWMIQ